MAKAKRKTGKAKRKTAEAKRTMCARRLDAIFETTLACHTRVHDGSVGPTLRSGVIAQGVRGLKARWQMSIKSSRITNVNERY
jgi:hypothetical protein